MEVAGECSTDIYQIRHPMTLCVCGCATLPLIITWVTNTTRSKSGVSTCTKCASLSATCLSILRCGLELFTRLGIDRADLSCICQLQGAGRKSTLERS